MYADEHEPAREASAAGARRRREPRRRRQHRHRRCSFSPSSSVAPETGAVPTSMRRQCSRSGEQQGLDFQGGAALWIRGLVDAYLGRLDEARARATEGVSRSREENEQAFLERNLALLGLIDLSTGDYAAAAERLAPVVRRRQARGAGEPSLYPARELAIEALVAVGDLDEARVQLEWLEEAGRRLADSVAACDGRALPGPAPGGRGRPRKRRSQAASRRWRCTSGCRCRSSAPAPCSSTARSFAGPSGGRRRGRRSRRRCRSSRRCRRRSGPRTRAPSLRGSAAVRRSGDGLTEGERRIAELVAAGKSNKETAAALFLSVHTVEDALKRIYRKLGVRSRTELSRRLTARRAKTPDFRSFGRSPLDLASEGCPNTWSSSTAVTADPDSAALARLGDGTPFATCARS